MIEAIMMTLISNLFETLRLMISIIDKGCFIKCPAPWLSGEVQYSLVFSKAGPDGGAEVGGCLGVEAGRWRGSTALCDYISQVPSPHV